MRVTEVHVLLSTLLLSNLVIILHNPNVLKQLGVAKIFKHALSADRIILKHLSWW